MKWLTKLVGYVFFGGWALLGTIFYLKAVADFVF